MIFVRTCLAIIVLCAEWYYYTAVRLDYKLLQRMITKGPIIQFNKKNLHTRTYIHVQCFLGLPN